MIYRLTSFLYHISICYTSTVQFEVSLLGMTSMETGEMPAETTVTMEAQESPISLDEQRTIEYHGLNDL